MATEFRSHEDLCDTLANETFDQPPAIVCNAHITGLGVARALKERGVPVIAIDRVGDGAAPFSDAVDYAGAVTFPLDDEDAFRRDVEAIADATGHEPVAFACMDEWVHAFARTEPAGVRLPFAHEKIDAVLDKESLYSLAEDLDVPYPETYRLSETDGATAGGRVDPDQAADALGFPLVVKPALKREFEEAVGTNVIEVQNREEFYDVVENARREGIRVMAQEKVPIAEGEDCSLASYVPPEGNPITFTGNARVRYPRAFGTSCVVEGVDAPEIEERALAVLEESGYYGISESEFVYDAEREEYVLLDVNTRPWKWIGLPVSSGANLPLAAYSDAVGDEYEANPVSDTRWVYLPDYLSLLASDETFADVLSRSEWVALLSGAFEDEAGLTTGVYRPSDPEPIYRVLQTEFGGPDYYCSC